MNVDRLTKARDLSEQIAEAVGVLYFRFMLFALDKPEAKLQLEQALSSFDCIFKTWVSEMDDAMNNALEISSPRPFADQDSISREYIYDRRAKILASISDSFPEELILGLDPNHVADANASWLWAIAQTNNVGLPKHVARRLWDAWFVDGSARRQRMRLEFNAAIRWQTQLVVNPSPAVRKKTTTDLMMQKVLDFPTAAGWSLVEWEGELNRPKSTISSSKAYKSDLMRSAREFRKAAGKDEFRKDPNSLDGERRRSD